MLQPFPLRQVMIPINRKSQTKVKILGAGVKGWKNTYGITKRPCKNIH